MAETARSLGLAKAAATTGDHGSGVEAADAEAEADADAEGAAELQAAQRP
jgi:hypothetical protein